MESIKLENINDAIKRENLFKKVAMKALNELEYKKVPEDYKGEKLRTRRELDDLEKNFVDKDAEKKKKHEKKLEKKIKEVEEEEEIYEEMSAKERKLKNKKNYHQTKGQRKKKSKSKKKANRSRRS